MTTDTEAVARQAERDANPMRMVSADGESAVCPPHQQRVFDEKAELDIKLEKLAIFIRSSPLFDGLPPDDRGLLRAQLLTMRQYSAILEQRIALF